MKKWTNSDLAYAKALQATLVKMKGEFTAMEISQGYHGFKWLDEVVTEIEEYLKNPTPQTFQEGITTAKVEETNNNKSTSPLKPTTRKKKTSKGMSLKKSK